MKRLKIFTATFEESMNFEDDPLLNWQNKYINSSTDNEKPILLFIISILLIILLYVIYLVSKAITLRHYKDSPIPKADINFLPFGLFLLMLVLFVIFWLYSHLIRFKAERLFWTHVNVNNIFIWLMLEINLMFVTMFFKSLKGWGILILYIALTLLTSLFMGNQIRSLKKILFPLTEDVDKDQGRKNRIVKYVLSIDGLLFIIYIILKIMFPDILIIKTGIGGFIMITSLWFIINILFLLIEIYVELPFFSKDIIKENIVNNIENGKKCHRLSGMALDIS
ncbi:hypothetical protein [Lactococcus cremoris]|uniref:hypothetical protein n=1 Tax=Lactococcus lactis subsp. cremoris TaxID=1359 RepID=UPI0021821378|nr:hypothetical protein [Lactococcus cremoris]MCT0506722.1 hypothetical protein [Lactococcus cremoris]